MFPYWQSVWKSKKFHIFRVMRKTSLLLCDKIVYQQFCIVKFLTWKFAMKYRNWYRCQTGKLNMVDVVEIWFEAFEKPWTLTPKLLVLLLSFLPPGGPPLVLFQFDMKRFHNTIVYSWNEYAFNERTNSFWPSVFICRLESMIMFLTCIEVILFATKLIEFWCYICV